MTYSNTYSSPSSPTNFNPFSGMGMRKGGRPSLFPGSGDGSTLSLDFTTGVLDPRLTFSRASTATFVNSSGYVEWAASNEMTYSQSQDSNTFWSAFGTTVVRTSAQTDPNGGTAAVKLVFTATAADAVISRTVAVNNGLPYTISMWMRSDSGTLTNVRFARGAAATGAFFPTLTTTWQRVSLSFTASGSADGIEIRVLNSGSPQTATFHVYGAQLESGSTVRTYQPALAAAAYYAPRFDYSPTNIGQPRGLLIEGQTVNYFLYNSLLSNVTWQAGTGGANDVTMTYPAAGITDPSNGSSAGLLSKPNTSSGYGFFRQTSMNTGAVSGNRTVSCWFKQPTSNAARYVGIRCSGNGFTPANAEFCATFDLQNGVVVANAGTNQYTNVLITAYPNGWYKCSATSGSMGTAYTTIGSVAIVQEVTGTEFNGIQGGTYIWGLQIELGSGASSYIPTGASQVTRNVDNCYIYDATTLGGLSWFKTATQGTFLVQATKRTAGTAFAGAFYGTRATATQDFMLYQAIGNNWLSLNWGASEYVTNYSALSSPFLIKSAVAFSPGSPTTKADSTVSINGSNSAINTTPNIALPFASDLFCIGSRGSAGGSVPTQNYADTAIQSIKFYPFAMTAAQMNTLTTL